MSMLGGGLRHIRNPIMCFCAGRAIAYAISKGVTIVAAAGNDNVDLGHLSGMHDISSPNNGNPIARKISNVRVHCCCMHLITTQFTGTTTRRDLHTTCRSALVWRFAK